MLLPSLKVHAAPLSYAACATYAYDQKLAEKFTLQTRFGDSYSLYRKRGPFIELPRNCCPIANDGRSLGAAISCNLTVQPRDAEQARVIAEQNALLAQGQSFTLEAGTGTGKSFIACNGIAFVKRKALIVVPKEDLMDQWVSEAILKFTDIKPHEIGIIQADKVNVEGKKVVMAMLHSLAIEDRYDPAIFADFGIVYVDEAHRSAADSLSSAFHHIPARLRVALTATVKRADGKEQVVYAHVGPIRVSSKRLMLVPKVMRIKTAYKLPRVPRKDPDSLHVKIVQLPHGPGKIAHIVTKMSADHGRNKQIANMLRIAWSKGRKIAVVCDQLDHITALIHAAKEQGIPLSDMARYVGGLTPEQREAAKLKRIIFATFGAFKEGTDIPALDTMILASPKSDVVQIVGRILREFKDKKEPLVIDFVDEDSPVLHGYWHRRKSWYKSIGANIVDIG